MSKVYFIKFCFKKTFCKINLTENFTVENRHNTVSHPPCQYEPRTLSNLWCVIAAYDTSELEFKVMCVISNSTIFLLVASFVMKKINKRYSYDAGYKLKVIPCAEHGNRAAERHFSPPRTGKTICDWQASKEQLKKITIFRDFKGQFGFIN